MTTRPYDPKEVLDLMETAVAVSQNDGQAWAVLKELLVTWAEGNEGMRLELLAALQEAGKGKQGEHRKAPIRHDIELVLWVEECENRIGHGALAYALDHLAERLEPSRYPTNETSFRTRVAQAWQRLEPFGYRKRESVEAEAQADREYLEFHGGR